MITIMSRCHQDWVPDWPHTSRIDEFGNLAIMSQCHRPEVPEWNEGDRLDDLVNAMHCRTGQVEPGHRPTGDRMRFHLKGAATQMEHHEVFRTPLDRYMGLNAFKELMNDGTAGLCPMCVDRVQLHQQGLMRL